MSPSETRRTTLAVLSAALDDDTDGFIQVVAGLSEAEKIALITDMTVYAAGALVLAMSKATEVMIGGPPKPQIAYAAAREVVREETIGAVNWDKFVRADFTARIRAMGEDA